MDPLAQLKDIHLPADVHSYPIAPGWWLLIVIVLIGVIFSVVKLKQFIAIRKAKKLALKQLHNADAAETIVKILKWALLQYFPRQQVANLTGDELKAYLTNTLPEKHHEKFLELSHDNFNNVYQKLTSQTTIEFSQAASLWLTYALPPRKISGQNSNNQIMKNLPSHTEKSTNVAASTSTKELGVKS